MSILLAKVEQDDGECRAANALLTMRQSRKRSARRRSGQTERSNHPHLHNLQQILLGKPVPIDTHSPRPEWALSVVGQLEKLGCLSSLNSG